MLLLLALDIIRCNMARLQHWNRFMSQNWRKNSTDWAILQYGYSFIVYCKCHSYNHLKLWCTTSMFLGLKPVSALTQVCCWSALTLSCLKSALCINWLNSDTVPSQTEHSLVIYSIVYKIYSAFYTYIDTSCKEQFIHCLFVYLHLKLLK